MQAETKVTRPPEAVRIRASSTVFWNASNARKRLLPIDSKRGGLETRWQGRSFGDDWLRSEFDVSVSGNGSESYFKTLAN